MPLCTAPACRESRGGSVPGTDATSTSAHARNTLHTRQEAIPTSDKVAALHRDPRIALTIDVYPPPCCLLVRGTAELREEDEAWTPHASPRF